MASFVVLTPPGGPLPDHRTTLLIRDGFSFAAFVFPLVYLLLFRLWLPALGFLLLQGLLTLGLEASGAPDGAYLILVALNLWPALEAGNLRVAALVGRGHRIAAVIAAPDLETAEAIFFSGEASPAASPARAPSSPVPQAVAPRPPAGPALGLIDY